MSRLLELQQEFAVKVGDFIGRLNIAGYQVTLGEAYRTPEQAALNAKKGIGSKNSLHCDRLAIDLNLFKDGKYLSKTEDYKIAGEIWESMGGTWGGRFTNSDGTAKPDGNHFSTAFMGRK